MTPDSRRIRDMADEATVLLKALAHPARLLICCQLRAREMSVGEIEETLGIRQPRLSRELGKLREEGLVETRRMSKLVYYRLSGTGRVRAMVDAICHTMLDTLPADGGLPPHRADAPGPAALPPTPKPNRAGGYGVFARTGLKS